MAGGAVISPLTLDADYQLRVQNMGTLNGRGKTYLKLREEVIGLVSRNYPLSGASFTLTHIGHFNVIVTGETLTPGIREVDGLTRVSAMAENLTEKASIRFIQVNSVKGILVYDTFKSAKQGDLSQNPYIRPGDRIHIPKAGRIVTIEGEVFRPGVYELLPGESLEELVEYYGDGFTLRADPERMRLFRINTPQGIVGEGRTFSYGARADVVPEDRDRIIVENKLMNLPAAFFEGAISQPTSAIEETNTAIEGTSRMEYSFYPGETLGNAIRAMRDRFTIVSDLENGYLIRGNNQLKVDLRGFIYYNDFTKDLELENGDRIIIPFHQYFVLVSGAVKAPGRYPYVPDRTLEYYVNLAGGMDELLNNGSGMKVYDINSKHLANTETIPPESMIHVPANKFSVKFNQYGPIITTILSIISTTISILILAGTL
jgi:protein involved in polysaccharide export with SLBB domain